MSLHAIPDSGYRFVNWNATICDPDISPGIAHFNYLYLYSTNEWLDFEFKWGASEILATFEPGWRLQVNVPFGGWVTNNPPGLDYASDAHVTLTAAAKPNFVFSGWTGDFTGTNPVATVKMTTNLTITANFQPTSTPQLVLQPSDAGNAASSNRFGFALLGTPGGSYSIESSPDLTHWSVFAHLTATNAIIPFTDALSKNGGAKYYRAHLN